MSGDIATDVLRHSANHTAREQPFDINIVYNALWSEIHTKQNPTAEWLTDWLSRIPNYGCDCLADLREYLTKHPPRYNDWFGWTWKLHNAVNAKLGKPIQSMIDAKACWLTEAPLVKPRLVITIATGDQFHKLLDVTRPTMEAYAARCNADFIAITNKQHDHWHGDKFRVNDFASQYDQTLFLDADVVVKESCPDLFSLYPDCVAMHNDLVENARTCDMSWARAELRQVLASQGVDDYPFTRLLNSGVVLCTPSTNPWTPPIKPLSACHCAEQFLVDHQAGPDCKFLPIEFNLQHWMKDFWDRVPQANIVHLAGCADRIQSAKRIIDESARSCQLTQTASPSA